MKHFSFYQGNPPPLSFLSETSPESPLPPPKLIKSPLISGTVAGKTVNFLLDSGSPLSLVSEKFFSSLPQEIKQEARIAISPAVRSLTGASLHLTRQIRLQINFPLSPKITHSFYVANYDLPAQFLVGTDFFHAHSTAINFKKQHLSLYNTKLAFANSPPTLRSPTKQFTLPTGNKFALLQEETEITSPQDELELPPPTQKRLRKKKKVFRLNI